MRLAGVSCAPERGPLHRVARLPIGRALCCPGCAENFLGCGGRVRYDVAWVDHLCRPHYRHSGYFTHVQLTEPEMESQAIALADALNAATGPTHVLLPMGGFSHEDRPGGAIEAPRLREIAADVLMSEARTYALNTFPTTLTRPTPPMRPSPPFSIGCHMTDPDSFPDLAEKMDELIAAARRCFDLRLQTNAGGNLSLRLSCGDAIVIKPSGVGFAECTRDNLQVVRLDGTILPSEHRPSKDLDFHLDLYRIRSDINAIVHCHSPWATGYASAGLEIPCLTVQTIEKIGRMPLIPLSANGGPQTRGRDQPSVSRSCHSCGGACQSWDRWRG